MAETATQEPQTTKVPALKAILAKKMGMTQIFDAKGLARPATELLAGPCWIVSVKNKENDGYEAVILGFGPKPENRISKPLQGIFKKAAIGGLSYLKEVRVAGGAWKAGQQVGLEGMFVPGDYVDVRGISKGKGFAGVVKRWGFHGGPKTHGQSDRHRAPGSLAGRRSLGRVLPGKKMAGHLGAEQTTVLKMEVVKVDPAGNRLYIHGGVPGPKGAVVFIRQTVKKLKHHKEAQAAHKPSKKRQAAPAKK